MSIFLLERLYPFLKIINYLLRLVCHTFQPAIKIREAAVNNVAGNSPNNKNNKYHLVTLRLKKDSHCWLSRPFKQGYP